MELAELVVTAVTAATAAHSSVTAEAEGLEDEVARAEPEEPVTNRATPQ